MRPRWWNVGFVIVTCLVGLHARVVAEDRVFYRDSKTGKVIPAMARLWGNLQAESPSSVDWCRKKILFP
jgi:hypothetical protein